MEVFRPELKQIEQLKHLHHASQLSSQTAFDHPYNEKIKTTVFTKQTDCHHATHHTTQSLAVKSTQTVHEFRMILPQLLCNSNYRNSKPITP